MQPNIVTRRFLRLRSALALGILLLAALVAVAITAWGRAYVDQRDMVARNLDTALIAVSRMTRTFDLFVRQDGSVSRSARRSDLRVLADQAEATQAALRRIAEQGRFAPETARIAAIPSLDPVAGLAELVGIARRLADGDQPPEREERLGAVGAQVAERITPVFLQMKETERRANAAAGALTQRYGLLTLAISVFALLATVKFVHLPMERAILRAQDQIAEGLRAAEAASEAKTQFLATMSHEVRTPMNGILGMTELLRSTELDQKQGEMLDIIGRSGGALLEIIDDVLDLAKIEAGKLHVEKKPFDVAETCQDVAHLFSGRAASKGVRLTFSLTPPDHDWRRNGDAKALRQVVSNLVGNAIKFTDDGVVSLSVSLARPTAERAHPVEINVRDDGIGIPASAHARIFERFEQADASTTRTHGGTGLGLSIVLKLTEAMGGTITLTSDVGRGAEFVVRIPFERIGAEDRGDTAREPEAEKPPSQPAPAVSDDENWAIAPQSAPMKAAANARR